MNKELNELTEWFIASDRVQIPDSVKIEISEECKQKGIDRMTYDRNSGLLRMFFNEELSIDKRVKIADYILLNYSEKPYRIPIDLVAETKRKLLLQLVK